MATIILRDAGSIASPGSSAKGSPLTNLEVDNNFSNINLTLSYFNTGVANVNIIDDITTNATFFPAFVSASSGNANVKVSSTKLTFNPSSGL